VKSSEQSKQDIWKEWLLERRFGSDSELMNRTLREFLYPVRDKILDRASLQEGETLLDVGCGDGLVAFGALARLESGRVLFSDISQELLNHAATLAQQMGVAERCNFIRASATDLAEIAMASVDVVTTRSVLIYVADKAKAFAEFFRVLKGNGRISIFEPINNFGWPEPRHIFSGFDVTPIMELTDKIKAVSLVLQPPDTDPMLNFDERDLFALAEAAGFAEINVELSLELKPYPEILTWDVYVNRAPNPKVPTLKEVMDKVFTDGEKKRFTSHLRPQVELGQGKMRSALAYLCATKI
jgi:ubiquinone/menaquinone biosynthesis C-methylase UbiE